MVIRWVVVGWLWLILAGAAAPAAAAAGSAASPEGVDVPVWLERMVVRARSVASATNGPLYVFRKQSINDTLDADGGVKRSKEKLYEVTLMRGMTHNRLVAVDGVRLSEEESAALSEKERRWRETYSSGRGESGGGSGADRMDQLVNEKLMGRFEFTAEGWETVRGRRCVVLAFRPKPGELPEERLMDRVINRFRGRVWVDEEEAEIARAEVATEGTMRVWGGVLGSLERFELHLDRERSRYGVWFNRHAEIRIRARRLFSLVSMRVREIGNDLRPVE